MEKTEPPSPRRLKKARAAGDVPVTPLLGRAAGLLVLAVLGPAAAATAVDRFGTSLRAALAPGGPPPLDARDLGEAVSTLAFPLLGAMTFAAVAFGVAQTGGVVVLSRGGKSGRPSRTFGLGRILDGGRALSLLVGLVTGAALLVLGWCELAGVAPALAGLLDSGKPALGVTGEGLLRLLLVTALVVGAGAAIDWLLRRELWMRRLRMSRQEVRQERREEEGAPEIRRARQRIHEELARDGRVNPSATETPSSPS